MNLEKIKNYLNVFLESVVIPKINEERSQQGYEPINLEVFQILKGSYQPPTIHVFLDSEPKLRKGMGLKPATSLMVSRIEQDIRDFLKSFFIFKIAIHWNKRPIFKNDSLHSTDF